MQGTLNFNVGVLGHIDSGKTSLTKALSTVASTASFDKNPQSRERGITLDLGFSSFTVDIPEHLRQHGSYDKLQFTLVDCPGHASLIRTIIGGAQIIDLMMLVVDVTKGIQTQTAECLLLGEITCEKMVVVLNKIDLLPEDKRQSAIEKMSKKFQKTLEATRFHDAPIIPVAAKPGGPEAQGKEAEGMVKLIDILKACTYKPQRVETGPFIFAVDHCFSIRGQGTVMTGTVLSGRVVVNDTVEIPSMKMTKKVKAMQMFRQPVEKAIQGDRVGICVTQFDPKLLERGLVSSVGVLPTITAAIISVQKIKYFKGPVATKSKFHITMGHETVMGKVSFFGQKRDGVEDTSGAENNFNLGEEYIYQEELHIGKSVNESKNDNSEVVANKPVRQYALIMLEKPVTCAPHCLVIGSKLDTDIHANVCRLSFHGHLLLPVTDPKYPETLLPNLKVYKIKQKEGLVERIADDYSVIGKSLFKKESNIQLFVGLKVKLSTGEDGVIEGGFGQSGKFKVRIPNGLLQGTKQKLSASSKKKGKAAAEETSQESDGGKEPVKIYLIFKRYIYDPKKEMIQID
ncbi:selenocysteine-specific elongation factor-like isoform X1 [Lingula anatina]|uniref:Selenocysteine-specific elongation factor n=1 Tax=Lingula anatina TaxID=7574 RepID=A0A1S3KC21_LINAN|nr:selenocysteine-specific elongation factor-like isoform X1 [Lingula anatina]|eukprot:XP_013420042.1 selenocysteine-specific elongation factor-like isoform X1 [Lingula anatina]